MPTETMSTPQCGRGWARRCANSHGKHCRCRCGGANHGTAAGVVVENNVANDRHARFAIVRSDAESVTIRDLGPWDRHLTVTNDAEYVVAKMRTLGLGSRRLFYYDSLGQLDEIVHERGVFRGFLPGSSHRAALLDADSETLAS